MILFISDLYVLDFQIKLIKVCQVDYVHLEANLGYI